MTLDERKRLAEYDCVSFLIEPLLKIGRCECGNIDAIQVAMDAMSEWDAQRKIASNKAEVKYNEQGNQYCI